MSSKAQIRNTDRLDKQEQQRETNTTNKYLLSIYSLQGVSRSMRQDPCSFRAYFLLLNKVRIMLYIMQLKTFTLYQMLSQGSLCIHIYKTMFKLHSITLYLEFIKPFLYSHNTGSLPYGKFL